MIGAILTGGEKAGHQRKHCTIYFSLIKLLQTVLLGKFRTNAGDMEQTCFICRSKLTIKLFTPSTNNAKINKMCNGSLLENRVASKILFLALLTHFKGLEVYVAFWYHSVY